VNKAELYILAANLDKLDKNRLQDIRSIVKDFAYFQAAQVLLLKNLANISHYEYDNTLKKTAISVPNRKHLFEIITGQCAVIIPDKVQEIDNSLNDNETHDRISVDESAGIDAFISERVSTVENNAIIEITEEASGLNQISAPDNEQKVNEVSAFSDISQQHSFIEWLKLASQIKDNSVSKTILNKDESVVNSDLTFLNVDTNPAQIIKTNDVISNNITSASQQEQLTTDKKSNIEQFESVLDKFIRENPRISRPKSEFYKPSNMAKQSVQENDELATETLAKVYLSQGHYKKAIRVYEKLCLLYPNRIIYFADLIQKIKNEHKD
jgi:tetratricopeptide (TPR) repeat protein